MSLLLLYTHSLLSIQICISRGFGLNSLDIVRYCGWIHFVMKSSDYDYYTVHSKSNASIHVKTACNFSILYVKAPMDWCWGRIEGNFILIINMYYFLRNHLSFLNYFNNELLYLKLNISFYSLTLQIAERQRPDS